MLDQTLRILVYDPATSECTTRTPQTRPQLRTSRGEEGRIERDLIDSWCNGGVRAREQKNLVN